jgi:hypothetical protein
MEFTTMLTRNQSAKVLPLFLWTAFASPQSPTGGASHHRQVQIPIRPAALFTSEQGRQRTEIHFDPTSSTVTMKLLVQDPAGYFIPGLHRDNFAVYESIHEHVQAQGWNTDLLQRLGSRPAHHVPPRISSVISRAEAVVDDAIACSPKL